MEGKTCLEEAGRHEAREKLAQGKGSEEKSIPIDFFSGDREKMT